VKAIAQCRCGQRPLIVQGGKPPTALCRRAAHFITVRAVTRQRRHGNSVGSSSQIFDKIWWGRDTNHSGHLERVNSWTKFERTQKGPPWRAAPAATSPSYPLRLSA